MWSAPNSVLNYWSYKNIMTVILVQRLGYQLVVGLLCEFTQYHEYKKSGILTL